VVELPAWKRGQRWCRDPEDDKFIRCAQAGKCSRIVTGRDVPMDASEYAFSLTVDLFMD
jgi:predicted nucleic acid-binding protein